MTITYDASGKVTGFTSYNDLNTLFRSGSGQALVFDMQRVARMSEAKSGINLFVHQNHGRVPRHCQPNPPAEAPAGHSGETTNTAKRAPA